MVAFITSLVITGVMCGIVLVVARRRPPGTPLTWGEALLAATFVFALTFMLYGVVPHLWIAWADNELGWRSDKFGIPVGPFKFLGNSDNVLFADGISFFGRGRIVVSAQTVRDIIASGFYVVFLVGQIVAWLMWQRRGKAPTTPELETSAFGRPLLRRAT